MRGSSAHEAMRVVVFGAGAVGGHLAARLAAHGPAAGIEVAAVARGAQLAAMNQRGVTLWIGEECTSAPIHATYRPETLGHQDVVLVTLKSSVLPAAAEKIRNPCAAAIWYGSRYWCGLSRGSGRCFCNRRRRSQIKLTFS